MLAADFGLKTPVPELADNLLRPVTALLCIVGVPEPFVRRGSTYLTHGTDRFGQRLRLVMDARNGELIGLRVVGEGRAPRTPQGAP